MTRRCIVHIGIHKTGSSAIQQALMVNRPHLEEAGILYPSLRGREHATRAHHGLAYELRGIPKQSRCGFGLNEFATLLRETSAEFVVISSEVLSLPGLEQDRVERLAEIVVRAGFELTVVAYVRPQEHLINSAYGQGVKGFKFSGPFAAFVDKRLAGLSLSMIDRLRPWIDAEGVGFVAVPYSAVTIGPSIAKGMLNAAGISRERIDAVSLSPAQSINAIPGPRAIAAFRLLTLKIPDLAQHPKKRKIKTFALEEARRRGWLEERFTGFDNAGAGRIRQSFAEDNELFAQRFFTKPWRDVFAQDHARSWQPNEIDLNGLGSELRSEFEGFEQEVTKFMSHGVAKERLHG